jgi:MFS family permease
MSNLRNNGAFRALLYPDYFWFWSSYFVSNVGSWMQSIAMGWLLFDMTTSPLYLGLFSSLRMVMLLSFFIIGGILSDRIDRRKAMLWIQFIAAGTSLLLALLVSSHAIRVWHIFVLGALTSTTWAFEQPVRQALLPQLVPRDVLVNALALNALTWNGAGLLGPSLVGISVGSIGIAGCFYVNVVSYLAVVGALVRMRVPANMQEPGRGTVLQSLLGGFRYVRAEPVIFNFLAVSAIFNIFGRSYATLLPVFAKEVLRVGASGFGFLAAGPGLGTIFGSLTLASLGRVEAKRWLMVSILITFVVMLCGFAVSREFSIAVAFLVAIGALSTVFETLLSTSIQLRVDETFRGRVSGFYGLTGGGLREFGGMQAGFVAEWTSAPFAIGAGAIALAIIGYVFLGARLKRLVDSV